MSNETPSPATLAGPRSPESNSGHGSTSSGPTTLSGRVTPDGHAEPGDGGGVSKETRRRVIAASFIGNFVEWFDYAVYGYLAVT
ncbi:MFS transporter, partial [Arthrobacter sp. PsM3]|nr:MFS transporter [Arthrobacter sp. PsM3]